MKIKLNVERLERMLSHGSGIDCAWGIEDKGSYFKACNSYHAMNEWGMYDGYADFSLIIPKADPLEFRLHFHGNRAQYLNQRYMLREYLEDVFAYDLHAFGKQAA